MWKQLCGKPLTIGDITEVDKDFVPGNNKQSLLIFYFKYIYVIDIYESPFIKKWAFRMKKKGTNEFANSVDSDEMAHYEPSHLNLHYLHKKDVPMLNVS